ncbi:MAG: hypothetical protein ACMXYA_02830 [Candidatus Woesearchaeota archaeon]
MEPSQIFIYLVLILFGLLILRMIVFRLMINLARKQVFYRDYLRILQSPQYKVKGKYEQ